MLTIREEETCLMLQPTQDSAPEAKEACLKSQLKLETQEFYTSKMLLYMKTTEPRASSSQWLPECTTENVT